MERKEKGIRKKRWKICGLHFNVCSDFLSPYCRMDWRKCCHRLEGSGCLSSTLKMEEARLPRTLEHTWETALCHSLNLCHVVMFCWRRWIWLLSRRQWSSGFHNRSGIPWLEERLTASQEGLFAMELGSKVKINFKCIVNMWVWGCDLDSFGSYSVHSPDMKTVLNICAL
jgi:hypothetical protein